MTGPAASRLLEGAPSAADTPSPAPSGTGDGGRPAARRGRRPGRHRDNKAAALFLLPWLIGLLAFTVGPMAASFYFSFSDFTLLKSSSFAGLDNYRAMLEDDRFASSLRVTFVYVMVSVPLKLAFALVVAAALKQGLRGLSGYRALYYLPSLLGGSVAVAIMWRQVFGGDGLLNQLLGLVGFTDLPSWVTDPDHALDTLIVLAVWQFGTPMVIFLAGLKQIPQEMYEAASVDGAGPVRRFLSITLPLLSPIIFFNFVLQLITSFQAFNQAYIVSGGTGGPADATLFYTLYLYQKAFLEGDMGYASAMAWVLLLIIGAFTALNFAVSRFWVHYDDGKA